MYLRPEPSASIYSHEVRCQISRDAEKATAINRRQSATSLMLNRIRGLMTKDKRLRGPLNKGRVFRLNWIKVRGLESAIFKLAL